ncbi:MAG: hypothetical protein FJ144_26020 [Deltaproteobacteria bacterium]|nr:hypothetical protein [Deltaproteobacteria bacterium]
MPNDAACDDGVFCNGADTCSGGSCALHAGDPCALGARCNDSCEESADDCAVAAGVACGSDANGCTDDRCAGVGACAHVPNTLSCEDGDACLES